MDVERRLNELGLTLPGAASLPPASKPRSAWVRVRGNRAFVSGHGALAPTDHPQDPSARSPASCRSMRRNNPARLATLAVLDSLDILGS